MADVSIVKRGRTSVLLTRKYQLELLPCLKRCEDRAIVLPRKQGPAWWKGTATSTRSYTRTASEYGTVGKEIIEKSWRKKDAR
jgi:hypothetical protein